MADHRFVQCDEELVLLPERAAYWPRRRTLILADPHFGKAAAFRAGGVPVPVAASEASLQRLDSVLTRTDATRLIFLGDLLHAAAGRTPAVLAAIEGWRRKHSAIEVVLVRGNHDHRAGDPPATWGFDCVDEPWHEPPFAWRHVPAAVKGAYAMAGHLHPAVRLADRRGHSLALPCFYFGHAYAVLPAFGEFRGTALVAPRPGERVVVVADGTLVEKTG